MPVSLNTIPCGQVFISVQTGQKYVKVNIRSGVPFQAICHLNSGGNEVCPEKEFEVDETFLII